jgi:hypothetical protein
MLDSYVEEVVSLCPVVLTLILCTLISFSIKVVKTRYNINYFLVACDSF